MKSGGAVVASDIPVHREIFRDAAEFFNPYSVDALSHAIETVIDPAKSARRRNSWQRAATVAERYSHETILPQWQSFLRSGGPDCAMNNRASDMSTDTAWEEWGRRDPYFGVITDPKFRRSKMNEEAEARIFRIGGPLRAVRLGHDSTIHRSGILHRPCWISGVASDDCSYRFARIVDEVVGFDVSSLCCRKRSATAKNTGCATFGCSTRTMPYRH